MNEDFEFAGTVWLRVLLVDHTGPEPVAYLDRVGAPADVDPAPVPAGRVSAESGIPVEELPGAWLRWTAEGFRWMGDMLV